MMRTRSSRRRCTPPSPSTRRCTTTSSIRTALSVRQLLCSSARRTLLTSLSVVGTAHYGKFLPVVSKALRVAETEIEQHPILKSLETLPTGLGVANNPSTTVATLAATRNAGKGCFC
ncbi:hypothetical protein F443_15979 [Phytophthora nicotianae P1569]|uniref:Uncharacterized protein n=1 Tax=Phytophthora nicotianae P1569 TaxID=1317065 RepID=V9EGE4_PHYNI|nr:hypothetical protein F443_15979 [Phytophthora nicotianae P1569]